MDYIKDDIKSIMSLCLDSKSLHQIYKKCDYKDDTYVEFILRSILIEAGRMYPKTGYSSASFIISNKSIIEELQKSDTFGPAYNGEEQVDDVTYVGVLCGRFRVYYFDDVDISTDYILMGDAEIGEKIEKIKNSDEMLPTDYEKHPDGGIDLRKPINHIPAIEYYERRWNYFETYKGIPMCFYNLIIIN